MPKRVLDKVWAYFDRAGPLVGRPWPVAYRGDQAERVETLRRFGVRRFTSLVYPHKPKMAAWLNEWAVGFAESTPDCLATATFYPEPDAPRYVDDAIRAGTRIFKAHLQVGDYDPNDPLLDDVWAMIDDAGVPVVIHCGSGPQPGRFTGPGPIRSLLRRHPQLPLVIAHMGMPEYRDFIDIAERFEQVRLDTTMVFTSFVEETMPFPAQRTRPAAPTRRQDLVRQRLPEHPLPVCRRTAYGHRATRRRRKLAAGRAVSQCSTGVFALELVPDGEHSPEREQRAVRAGRIRLAKLGGEFGRVFLRVGWRQRGQYRAQTRPSNPLQHRVVAVQHVDIRRLPRVGIQAGVEQHLRVRLRRADRVGVAQDVLQLCRPAIVPASRRISACDGESKFPGT